MYKVGLNHQTPESLSGFVTMNLYGGLHESGNRWKHKGIREFLTGSGCILVYYDLLSFGILPQRILYPKGVGLQGRSELVTLKILIETLSTQYLSIITSWATSFDFWIFPRSGPTTNGPFFLLSESFRFATHGTEPRQHPPSAWQVNIHSMISIFLE
jgi:hypothetical protein